MAEFMLKMTKKVKPKERNNQADGQQTTLNGDRNKEGNAEFTEKRGGRGRKVSEALNDI